MSQDYRYPSSAQVTVAAIGVNGAPIPTQSILIAGENPSLDLQPLQTDAAGNLLVSIGAEPATPLNVNIADFGGVAVALGQALMAASMPVVIASDQSTLNVSDSVTHTDLATINTTLGSPFQAGGSIGNTSFIATQASGANLHVNVDNFPATQPISGTVTVLQGTSPWVDNISQFGGAPVSLGQAAMASSIPVAIASDQSPITVAQATPGNLNATVFQPTGTNLHAVIDSGTVTANIGTTGGLALDATVSALQVAQGSTTAGQHGTLSLGAVTTAAPAYTTGQSDALSLTPAGALRVDGSATIQPVSGSVSAATPTPGSITQTSLTVGTSATRLTVSGAAPSATRSVLVATPDASSTAKFYVGGSGVTNTGAGAGVQIVAGQTFIANNDAGDYFIISDTAAQTVYVMEQA